MTRAAEGVGSSLAFRAATSPWVLTGLTVFAISAVAWPTTLSEVPLSVAYPFNALGYLGILTASVLILDGRTNLWTWIGDVLRRGRPGHRGSYQAGLDGRGRAQISREPALWTVTLRELVDQHESVHASPTFCEGNVRHRGTRP